MPRPVRMLLTSLGKLGDARGAAHLRQVLVKLVINTV